jgi:hypothetical protein
MKDLRRVSVITERGRLVGVYIAPDAPPRDPRAPVARVVAGPGQKMRELQIELPAALEGPKQVEAFHAAVRRKLKLRK